MRGERRAWGKPFVREREVQWEQLLARLSSVFDRRKQAPIGRLFRVIASASEAIHCAVQRKNGLLRFARNDVDTLPQSRGAMRPSRAFIFRPRKQRAWGMPGARRTRSLACKMKQSTRASSPRLQPDSPGIPARNGFNGLFRALPGDRAFLSPSLHGNGFRET